ncbi:Xaa-Pro peptidase family protein [uncultured Roseibium sp.]|uniref:M24 family metallopeptidase n=1 Tax=uncultured Roseibium sp. TaxID=1936171 RepID=UPI00259376DD|nr:Xaa-Pro peptidase family protein [uncultured Roseibium sp.]
MTTPDFPPREYERRLDLTQRAMREHRLDALLFTTEAELRYFTGFRTLFWQSPTRPWFLVLPAEGKPIAVIPTIGENLMATTWIDDIRTFSSPHADDDGLSLLTSALHGRARVGMPMGRETSLRMPLNDFTRLRDALPETEFCDATELVQALRMVKSELEIEVIYEICAIASEAFENAPNLFREGQSLKDTFRAFRIDLLQRGADDVPYLVGGAGPGGYGDVISPPSDKPLEAGDVLMLDTGATLNGYFCDFDRNFAIGHASSEARDAYARLHDATEAAIEAARPGMTCADLFKLMNDRIGGTGSNVGRLGHGLGMQLTEAPSLIDFDETILQEGMVITLEPSMDLSEGKMMVHEENIVIRDGPAQLLSRRAAPELPIL